MNLWSSALPAGRVLLAAAVLAASVAASLACGSSSSKSSEMSSSRAGDGDEAPPKLVGVPRQDAQMKASFERDFRHPPCRTRSSTFFNAWDGLLRKGLIEEAEEGWEKAAAKHALRVL